MVEEDAPARVHAIGLEVRSRWEELAQRHGLPMVVSGLPALSAFRIDGRDPALVKSFVTQRFLTAGHLAGPALYASIAHAPAVLDRYLELLDAILGDLAAMGDAEVAEVVGPEPAWTGFGRLA
jgi:hypothetical protein